MNMTISRKLTAGFAIAVIALMIIGTVSYLSIRKLNQTAGWVDHTHKVLGQLEAITSSLKDAETGQRGFLITNEPRYLQPYNNARTILDTAVAEVRRLTSDNPQQQSRMASLGPLVNAKFAELQETIDLRRNEGFDAALQVVLTDASKQVMDDIRALITTMSTEEESLLVERDLAAVSSAKAGMSTIVVGTVIAILFSVIAAFFIVRSITTPMKRMTAMVDDMAAGEGDLTQRLEISTRDEMGQLASGFNTFVEKLHNIISQVSLVTERVSSSATELSSTSEEIVAGSQTTSTQADTAASATEEMTQTALQIAENCTNAAQGATTTTDATQSGREVVQQTINGMNQIAEIVRESAQTIQALNQSVEKIGDVIGVIDDIADQTNLLALNAAIEAARAGDQGRGFAVVADEVRKLAESTAQSTQEITATIKTIQQETNNAVNSMQQGVDEVNNGTQLATQAGDALETIAQQMETVMDQIQQVATAAEEQTATIDETASNIQQIASAVQQSTVGAQQSTQAALQLAEQSNQLQQLVGQFKIHENGQGDRRGLTTQLANVVATSDASLQLPT